MRVEKLTSIAIQYPETWYALQSSQDSVPMALFADEKDARDYVEILKKSRDWVFSVVKIKIV